MASFEEIKEVRLKIDDPEGFIDFIEVADTASLPSDPAHQTAYKVTANSNYYSTSLTIGATPSDYNVLDLYVSDTQISAWIDAYGVPCAAYKAMEQIVLRLEKDLKLKRSTTGSETTEFQTLTDTFNYYSSILAMLKDDCEKAKGTNTGRWASTKPVVITGEGISPFRTFY